MSQMIKFGTDGWRAIIAEDFTFDNIRACTQGVANYLIRSGLNGQGLVIGYDTRFASEDFAAAAAEVIAGNGIKALLCEHAAPTPVISYLVTNTHAAGAIIITASHNPGKWNGFKYKDNTGASAQGDVVEEIEKNTNEVLASNNIKKIALDEGISSGKIVQIEPQAVYFRQVENLIDVAALGGNYRKIIVDSMYGAGIGYFMSLLKNSKMNILEINAERNPIFPGIQPEPIAKNLTKLSGMVVQRKADVGLATDGDADRIGIIDEKGNFINQHQVFALLALYFLEVRGERGAIIKSLCSTDMLYNLGKIFDVPVYETKVGFKYVAPLLKEKNAVIGGEESGGYGFRGHVPERDGILAGLYFLDLMVKTEKTPSQLVEYLFSKVGPHYYNRYDFHITPEQHRVLQDKIAQSTINSINNKKVVRLNQIDGHKYILADDSWLLIRFSGTEPLIRVYAESQSPEEVQELLDYGKKMLGL